MISGARACQARVLGHECVGVVELVGRGVASLSPGERVTINPVNPERPDEVVGHSIEGCFQERFVADAALVRQGRLVSVPKDVPSMTAVLAEPLATIVYASILSSGLSPRREWWSSRRPGRADDLPGGPAARGPRILLVYNRQSRFDWAVSRGILQIRGNQHGRVGGQGGAIRWLSRSTPLSYARRALRPGAPFSPRAASMKPNGIIDMIASLPDPRTLWAAINRVGAANCCGVSDGGAFLGFPADRGLPAVLVTGHRGTSAGHMVRASTFFGSMRRNLHGWFRTSCR